MTKTDFSPTLELPSVANGSKPAHSNWEAAAAHKREERANRLKPYAHWGLGDLTPPPSQKNVTSFVHARLTDRERSFLASDVTDLAQRLAAKEYTALEVTTAFCKATYAAQELMNCVTEVIFAQALARAQELDDHLLKTGRVFGPLHGVPVSVKDHIDVKGEDSACGFVGWAGRTIAKEDAAIVQILRAAGAVIYVKTTNPQSLFAFETVSNIYGCTTNPHNRDLTPGGSSGGEGALIASRASLLGVGTDLGGSVRGPSAWCGLYGFKASSHRLPASGLMRPYKGMENIVGVIGPMAHSARDLELFFKVVSDSEPWSIDFSTLCMPWNSGLAECGNEKLVVGLFFDDGVVAPHPPIVERLQKTREALIAAGHEVVEWTPMDHLEALELTATLYMLDGGEDIRAALAESGEPAIPHVARILPDPEAGDGCTLAQSWATNIQRDEFRARCTSIGTIQQCDPRAAGRLMWFFAQRLLPSLRRTGRRDLPAVVFPSGKPFDANTSEITTGLSFGEPRNPVDQFVRAQWDPTTFDGAPISLQLVGRRWQEEKLFAALKHVEEAMNQFETPREGTRDR